MRLIISAHILCLCMISVPLFADESMYQQYALPTGEDYPHQVGEQLIIPGEQRTAFVKDQDKDGYIYLVGFAYEGDPRTQTIWRLHHSVAPEDAATSWEFVMGTICPNPAGGENGQVWVKKDNTFYSAFWGGGPDGYRQWHFQMFFTTNAAGEIVAGPTAVNRERPVHRRGHEGWPACGQNVGAIIDRVSDRQVVFGGIRRSDAGKDLQIKRLNNTAIHQLWDADLPPIVDAQDYTMIVYDEAQNGRLIAAFSYDDFDDLAIWCVTNVNTITATSAPFKLIDFPGEGVTLDPRPIDIEIVDLSHPPEALFGGTLVVVSAITNMSNERAIFMFNADHPEHGVIDITPEEDLGGREWRMRLASVHSKLYFDTGSSTDDAALYSIDLKVAYPDELEQLGFIPEPGMLVGIIGISVLLLRRKHTY